MKAGALFAAPIIALAPVAHGAELTPSEPLANRWEAEVRGARVVLGDEHQTGGFMPQVAARRVWAVASWADVGLGAEFGVFGFGDETHWIGVLGGPTVSGSVRPWSSSVAIGLEVGGDFGRIPVCNDWGLCLRYVGFFPSFSAKATWYASKAFAIGAALSGRPVMTLAWQGASWEPSVHVRAFW